MNRRRWCVAVMAVSVVAACSGSGDEAAEPLVADVTTTLGGTTAATADDAPVGGGDEPSDPPPVTSAVPSTTTVEPGSDSEPDVETAPEPGTEAGSNVETEAETEAETDTNPDTDTDTDEPVDPAPASGSSGSSGSSGGSGTTSLAATGGGTTVSGPDLVPHDDAPTGCTASDDFVVALCLPATNGHSPYEAVSMGEYQTNVVVPDGAILDVYFDQSRSTEQMERLCREMGGVFHTRAYDGSPWGGWGYCAHVDYP